MYYDRALVYKGNRPFLLIHPPFCIPTLIFVAKRDKSYFLKVWLFGKFDALKNRIRPLRHLFKETGRVTKRFLVKKFAQRALKIAQNLAQSTNFV
jgi:hypothetical protein